MGLQLNCECGFTKELPDFYREKLVRCPSCSSIRTPQEVFEIEVDVLANEVVPALPDQNSQPPALPSASRAVKNLDLEGSGTEHPGAISLPLFKTQEDPLASANSSALRRVTPGAESAKMLAPRYTAKSDKRSNTLGNFNLAMGALIIMITSSPKLALALVAIYMVVTFLTVFSRSAERRLGIFPFVMIVVFALLGGKAVKKYEAHQAEIATIDSWSSAEAVSEHETRAMGAESVEQVNALLARGYGRMLLRDPESAITTQSQLAYDSRDTYYGGTRSIEIIRTLENGEAIRARLFFHPQDTKVRRVFVISSHFSTDFQRSEGVTRSDLLN